FSSTQYVGPSFSSTQYVGPSFSSAISCQAFRAPACGGGLFGSTEIFHVANCIQLALECEPIQLIDPQAGEQLQPCVELSKGTIEGAPLIFDCARHVGGIGETPVSRHRLPRPDGAYLRGRT